MSWWDSTYVCLARDCADLFVTHRHSKAGGMEDECANAWHLLHVLYIQDTQPLTHPLRSYLGAYTHAPPANGHAHTHHRLQKICRGLAVTTPGGRGEDSLVQALMLPIL